jgi:hypothetical protein
MYAFMAGGTCEFFFICEFTEYSRNIRGTPPRRIHA